MRRLAEQEFDRQWLILCEGEADKRFLDRFIAARNIGADFHVQFPDRHNSNAAGRSLFGRYLKTVHEASETFLKNVTAVLVVSDNDDDPATSFAEVQTELGNAGGYAVPALEQTVGKAAGFPHVVILMIPPGKPGNLETLCLAAAYDKWDIKAALDALVAAAPASDWGPSKQSKMRLQTMLASTCRHKPDTSFANVWLEAEEFHLPLEHASFDGLETFLRGFGALVA
jgi:hypothetical protein